QAEDGIRDATVTGVQTCALPIYVVFGQQDVPGTGVHLRLVLGHPKYLGGGEAGQRVVARDLDEPLPAQTPADFFALLSGPLVVPDRKKRRVGTESRVRGLVRAHV